MRTRKHQWSLIELTIILVVLSILCAILAPVMDRYIRNAKICRAREDVQAIGCCIWMFIEDTGNSRFYIDGGTLDVDVGDPLRDALGGGAPDEDAGNRVNILVSDGDISEIGPDGDGTWGQTVNFVDVDFLENHLVINTVGYRTPRDLNNLGASPMFARNSSGGFNSEFAWRGPYMTPPIDPDPWGNRYAVNVIFLDAVADSDNDDVWHDEWVLPGDGNGFTEDCIVLCTGPDEEVDTLFGVDGNTPGDDDIIFVVSANSRP